MKTPILTDDELRKLLCTCDGKGKEIKLMLLNDLLKQRDRWESIARQYGYHSSPVDE